MQDSTFLGGFGRFLESKNTGRVLTFLIIPALVIVILLLPPVQIFDRIRNIGYTPIDAASGQVADPDGTRVIFPADGLRPNAQTYAKLSSLPRADFERGDASEEMRRAAGALPANLRPRSPIYQLAINGDIPRRSSISVPIPNDSLPYETLDIYNWNGESWEWLPSRLVADEERLELDVNLTPTAFAVVQTSPTLPVVGAALPRGQTLPPEAAPGVTILYPTALLLRGDGSVDGVTELPAATDAPYKTFATARNYETGQTPRTDLLANLLIDGGMQEIQINTLAELAASGPYQGIAIDYRGVDPPLRNEFTRFVSNLAGRLHQDGKQLAVFVDSPSQVADDAWESYGYDWRALGAAADYIVIPGSDNPLDYAPGGAMEKLLAWATDEINRAKIQLRLPARTVEQAGNYFIFRGYNEALAALTGNVATNGQVVQPGENILASTQPQLVASNLQFDPATGISWYRYLDQSGNERIVFLEDGVSLAQKLSLANRFNLGGAYIEALENSDIDPATWTTLQNYATGGSPSMAEAPLSQSWTVTDAQGAVVAQAATGLNQPANLDIPDQPGVYTVKMALMKGEQPIATQESAPVAVATFTPTPTPTPEFTPTPTVTPTPTPLPFAVAVATGTTNLRQGPGTAYPTVGQLAAGQQMKIIGKNQNGSWWQLEGSDGKPVWIVADRVRVSGPVAEVAVATDIPAPPVQVAAAPAPAPASGGSNPPAPRPAGGGSFGYGMQIQPYGGADLGFAASAIKNAGFNCVKWQAPWKDMEGGPGAYSWQDDLVNFFAGQGLNILVSIVKSPNWARPGNTDFGVEGPPADPQTYANFVGAYAGRYCGKVKAIEVWNEQNLHYEWGNEPLDPARYMELLKRAYASIKAACPQTMVISGALTPAGNVGALAIDDFQYLEAMYRFGLKNYADGIGSHPSGYNVPPSIGWQQACDFIISDNASFRGPCDSPHHSWSARSTVEGYRNIMLKYGDGNKRVWPTEFGWAAGGALHPAYGYANDNSLDEQARWTAEFYQWMRGTGYVGPALLWNLNFGITNPGTELAQWAVWGRPVYDAIKNMPK